MRGGSYMRRHMRVRGGGGMCSSQNQNDCPMQTKKSQDRAQMRQANKAVRQSVREANKAYKQVQKKR